MRVVSFRSQVDREEARLSVVQCLVVGRFLDAVKVILPFLVCVGFLRASRLCPRMLCGAILWLLVQARSVSAGLFGERCGLCRVAVS